VLRGVNTFQSLEEERLNHLKTVLTAYLHHGAELGPRLIEVRKLKERIFCRYLYFLMRVGNRKAQRSSPAGRIGQGFGYFH
jgi:hypothetical protein